MNRKEFLNKIYNEIPDNKIAVCKPAELAKIVTTYLRENKLFMSNIKEIKVNNGVLYLDSQIVDRICEKDTKIWSEEAHYWEGRILKDQELY